MSADFATTTARQFRCGAGRCSNPSRQRDSMNAFYVWMCQNFLTCHIACLNVSKCLDLSHCLSECVKMSFLSHCLSEHAKTSRALYCLSVLDTGVMWDQFLFKNLKRWPNKFEKFLNRIIYVEWMSVYTCVFNLVFDTKRLVRLFRILTLFFLHATSIKYSIRSLTLGYR